MSVLDTLITDRTQSDVSLVLKLKNKGFAEMTTEEKTEYLAGMKGAYKASDLNRVGEAVAFLRDELIGQGYAVPVNPKTDWKDSDIPTTAHMAAYISDIALLRGIVDLPNPPPVPDDMDGLTVTDANNIEQILILLDESMRRAAQAWFYSGDLFSGEV